MNSKSRPKKKSIDNFPTGRTSNNFLNFTILLLSVVIIFLSYSVITKIILRGNNNNNEEKIGLTTKPLQIEVLNGYGISGIAEKFTDYLRAYNYDVVNIGNYRSFNVDNSLLIDRAGNFENATKIASALGIENNNIIQQVNKE